MRQSSCCHCVGSVALGEHKADDAATRLNSQFERAMPGNSMIPCHGNKRIERMRAFQLA